MDVTLECVLGADDEPVQARVPEAVAAGAFGVLTGQDAKLGDPAVAHLTTWSPPARGDARCASPACWPRTHRSPGRGRTTISR